MNEKDLYILFRKLQSEFLGRGYRLPKNIEDYFKNKFNKQSLEKLKTLSIFFLTKWQNIDPELYLRCGFEIFGKTFTYIKFFDEKILKLYIVKDKARKIVNKNIKESLKKSLIFIKIFMKENNIKNIEEYCRLKDINKKYVIDHYLKNKISSDIFIYFLIKRYIILNESDKELLPFINVVYRERKLELSKFESFIEKGLKLCQ